MNKTITASNPTDADRDAYRALVAESKLHTFGTPEWNRLQFAAADQLVSCYTSGAVRGEDVHETRRDGSCRCGLRKVRPARPSN